MKYISIDIETTGLSEYADQILQFAAVIEDTSTIKPLDKLPFVNYVFVRDRIVGSPYAIQMNIDLIRAAAKLGPLPAKSLLIREREFTDLFREFLLNHGYVPNRDGIIKFTVAGKNFASFDAKFIRQLPNWDSNFVISSRVIDPAILYVDWDSDEELPNTQTCMNRAGIDGVVAHDALEDAKLIIKFIRHAHKSTGC